MIGLSHRAHREFRGYGRSIKNFSANSVVSVAKQYFKGGPRSGRGSKEGLGVL